MRAKLYISTLFLSCLLLVASAVGFGRAQQGMDQNQQQNDYSGINKIVVDNLWNISNSEGTVNTEQEPTVRKDFTLQKKSTPTAETGTIENENLGKPQRTRLAKD